MNVLNKVLNVSSKVALKVTKMHVNSCCALFSYQPTLPDKAKKLNKFQQNKEV